MLLSGGAVSTNDVQIHPTAEVSPQAYIGAGTKIWHQAQVREGARIGQSCIIGKGVYIDFDVVIGNRVKIQNGASIYHGVTIEDGVFIGPHACLTNDKLPRAITPEGQLKRDTDWEVGKILIQYGASIGAGAIILPGVTVGRFAMVGAGAVVTKDVVAHGLVIGNPARLVGFVCQCGHRLVHLSNREQPGKEKRFSCPV
ncbi:MAG: N-acetyltransferase, partial [Chloroflexi bacterium]|nr:N-acetyltransferase [Chloroflexota bacterium]